MSQPLELEYNLQQKLYLSCRTLFELEIFEEILEQFITKLTLYYPTKMTQMLCKRFFLEQCEIIQILNSIKKASEEISNSSGKQNCLHIFYENVTFPLLQYLQNSKIDYLLDQNSITY